MSTLAINITTCVLVLGLSCESRTSDLGEPGTEGPDSTA